MKRVVTFLLFTVIISSFLGSSKSFAYGSYRSSFSSADSGWLVMPQGIYYYTNESQGGTNTSFNRYIFDPSLGYHFQLFYLGVEYNYDLGTTTQNGTPNSSDSYRSYGAQIGVISGGWQLLISYYFLSTATTNGGTSSAVDFTGGTGFQILGGYLFDIGSGFSIGPEFLYRALTYTSKANGQPIGSNYTFSTMVPQIGIKYMF